MIWCGMNEVNKCAFVGKICTKNNKGGGKWEKEFFGPRQAQFQPLDPLGQPILGQVQQLFHGFFFYLEPTRSKRFFFKKRRFTG